jgi:hypothetical protein
MIPFQELIPPDLVSFKQGRSGRVAPGLSRAAAV